MQAKKGQSWRDVREWIFRIRGGAELSRHPQRWPTGMCGSVDEAVEIKEALI